MITIQQNKTLHALLAQTGLTANKANLICGITNGRTESSKELNNFEANELIGYLRTQLTARRLNVNSNDERANRMRKKIISLAWQMNWVNDSGACDIPRINNWCIKYGYLHKPFNDYIYAELPKLLTQFENLYNSYLKAI